MDIGRLSVWEKMVGVAGLAMSLSLFGPWWELENAASGQTMHQVSGWEGLAFIDLIVFAGGLVVAGLIAAKASNRQVKLPISTGALVGAVGIACLIFTGYRTSEPPAIADAGGDARGAAALLEFDEGTDSSSVIQVSDRALPKDELEPFFVALAAIAAGLIAFGGWRLMRDEGTTPTDQLAQLRANVAGGGSSGVAGAASSPGSRTGPAAPAASDLPPPPPPPPSGPSHG